MIHKLSDGTDIDLSKIFAITTLNIDGKGLLKEQWFIYFSVCSEYHYINVGKIYNSNDLTSKGCLVFDNDTMMMRFYSGDMYRDEIDQFNEVVAIRDELLNAWENYKLVQMKPLARQMSLYNPLKE